MSAISHNLDIQSYRLEELLSLLDLPFKPTQEQMMRAKKKVLMFHPDKSRLPNEYFLFYRAQFRSGEPLFKSNNPFIKNFVGSYVYTVIIYIFNI
jgi:hypothetical protein